MTKYSHDRQGVADFLADRFLTTGYDTVTAWAKKMGIGLSLMAMTTVIHQRNAKGLIVMMTMAIAMDCTLAEIKWIAEVYGDKTLWRMLNQNLYTQEEKAFMLQFRALNTKRRKIVTNMIREMVPR